MGHKQGSLNRKVYNTKSLHQKLEKSHNFNHEPQCLRKSRITPRKCRQEETINFRAEVNEIEMEIIIQRNQWNQDLVLWND